MYAQNALYDIYCTHQNRRVERVKLLHDDDDLKSSGNEFNTDFMTFFIHSLTPSHRRLLDGITIFKFSPHSETQEELAVWPFEKCNEPHFHSENRSQQHSSFSYRQLSPIVHIWLHVVYLT